MSKGLAKYSQESHISTITLSTNGGYFPTNDVILTRSDTSFAWLANISSLNSFQSIKQHNNSFLLSKKTDTRKITAKSTSVSHAEIKIQNNHDLIQHAAQEKVATSTYFMTDVIVFSIQYSLQIKGFKNTKRQYFLY